MQTLKTAAIVVLLMTVMYGAYVSLTTPPEPLPAEIEGLVLNDEGSLDIDVGLPESLGDMNFNDAESGTVGFDFAPAGSGSASDTDTATLDAAAAATEGPGFSMGDRPGDNVDGLSGFDDVQDAVAGVGVQADLTDQGITAAIGDRGVSTSLSDSVESDGGVTGSIVTGNSTTTPRNYPRTNNTFELPDPQSVAAGFGGQNGAGSPNPSGLALTSGTSENQPPRAAELQMPGSAVVTKAGSKNLGLANAIRTADQQYAQDRRKDALATLSLFYNTPDLSGEQRSELLSRLDPLAAEVIYSTRHLLEQPYRVGQNETLIEVANQFEVPWQLLANINQIDDPVTILPGTELKVVRGPFRAEVNLTQQELTLFLDDLYAGRFPIGIGSDPAPRPGTFTVQDKQTDRTFYDVNGSPIAPGSRDNPYGSVWLDLGGQLCIHGSPSTTEPTQDGCISLSADYAEDLYGILSQGSSVTIRR